MHRISLRAEDALLPFLPASGSIASDFDIGWQIFFEPRRMTGVQGRNDLRETDMFGRLIGALVGREIDRRDGRGGLKGALIGAAAVGGMRRLGPLGLLLGGAYVAKKAMDRHKARTPKV
jgi:hypothetical protein